VRILHEEIAVADDRDLAVLAPTMDRDPFAQDVAVADLHAARPAGVGDLLRLVADYGIGMDYIVGANRGIAKNRDVSDQPGPRADANVAVDQAERADFHVVGQFDLAAQHGARMDASAHRSG